MKGLQILDETSVYFRNDGCFDGLPAGLPSDAKHRGFQVWLQNGGGKTRLFWPLGCSERVLFLEDRLGGQLCTLPLLQHFLDL